jgi:hypothetical protein
MPFSAPADHLPDRRAGLGAPGHLEHHHRDPARSVALRLDAERRLQHTDAVPVSEPGDQGCPHKLIAGDAVALPTHNRTLDGHAIQRDVALRRDVARAHNLDAGHELGLRPRIRRQ